MRELTESLTWRLGDKTVFDRLTASTQAPSVSADSPRTPAPRDEAAAAMEGQQCQVSREGATPRLLLLSEVANRRLRKNGPPPPMTRIDVGSQEVERDSDVHRR